MELRHYFGIVRRSWPLVVGLPLLVALLTIALWFVLPARYGLQVTMLVTQRPFATNETAVTLPDYNSFNSWAASEYIVDDILQLVETPAFARDITDWVRQQHGVELDPTVIQSGLSAERKHRTIYLSAEADSAEHANMTAQGAVAMLQSKGLQYWARDGQLDVSVLTEPSGAQRVDGLSALALNVVIRTLLAGLLAVGLAFLRYYLDQTLRQRGDVEALGFDVVGAIPVVKGAKG
jgi:capsular polysaccharide biosynthesis protein